ncbi:MAG: riboflavin synthase subunit alpha [Pseudomonadota bacterium]
MFTGIVQALLPIQSVTDEPNLRRLSIDLGNELAEGLELGASVAINGVCLTLSELTGPIAQFDIIHETLALTNLGSLALGSRVNVERSFTVGAEVGGHIVSGHVSCSVPVVDIKTDRNRRDLSFELPADWGRFILLKGYAAIDGASLTISELNQEAARFGVSLIPETIERTTLGQVEIGDRVNLEVDPQTQAIVTTVERMAASGQLQALLANPDSQRH